MWKKSNIWMSMSFIFLIAGCGSEPPVSETPAGKVIYEISGNDNISTPIKEIPTILDEPPEGIPSNFLELLKQDLENEGVSTVSMEPNRFSEVSAVVEEKKKDSKSTFFSKTFRYVSLKAQSARQPKLSKKT